jgi:integrase
MPERKISAEVGGLFLKPSTSERLGHSSIVLTLNTYSHVLPTMQSDASERLEKLCFGGVGTL